MEYTELQKMKIKYNMNPFNVRCNSCTNNDYLSIRKTDDGFWIGTCPRCENEYLLWKGVNHADV